MEIEYLEKLIDNAFSVHTKIEKLSELLGGNLEELNKLSYSANELVVEYLGLPPEWDYNDFVSDYCWGNISKEELIKGLIEAKNHLMEKSNK